MVEILLEFYNLFFAFLFSLILSAFFVLTKKFHGAWTNDNDKGVQKIHKKPTPRIGGLAIFISLWLVYFLNRNHFPETIFLILISSLPIVFVGLLEDITKSINPFIRFVSAILSSLFFILISGYILNPFRIIEIGDIVSNYYISLIFTVFCIVGVTNSINIIDGFNGLASGSIMLMLATFSYIAWCQEDSLIVLIGTLFIASNLGFLIFNFPFGKIFLGDSGAYFGGYILAIVAILITERNPQVSPWVSFLICSYPIIETLVSIHRKTVRKGYHFTKPDRLHLHMLVYRDLARNISRKVKLEGLRNPITSLIIIIFPLIFCFLSAVFYLNVIIIYILIATALYVYIKIYKSLSLQKK